MKYIVRNLFSEHEVCPVTDVQFVFREQRSNTRMVGGPHLTLLMTGKYANQYTTYRRWKKLIVTQLVK